MQAEARAAEPARIPGVHLVMHGSSSVPQEWLAILRAHGGEVPETFGVPVEAIQEAIRHGVRKVNIDTDLRIAMTAAIRRGVAEQRSELDPRKFFDAAMRAARRVCQERFEAFGAAGQAPRIRPIPLERMAARYAEGELRAAA